MLSVPMGVMSVRPALVAASLCAIAACGNEPVEPADRELPPLVEPPAVRTCLPDLPEVMPADIADTGCFTSIAPLEAGPDLIPFEVISPLWTDGAHKRRYMVLPPGETVRFDGTGAFVFPVGSVIVKVFELDLRDGDPASRHPVETRFMVLRETGWEFYSYQFDETASTASLIDRGMVIPFEVTTEDGGTRTIDYQFPSRDGCTACHGTRVGEPLGPRAVQLDLRARYGGEVKNQLEALAEIGVLDLAGGMPSTEPMPDPADTSAPLEARARAYLHSNCSHCHQPGGWTSPGVDMDLRYDKTLAEANICNVPVAFDLIPGGDHRIAAGDPEGSSIYRRLQVEGVGTPTQMPPLGRSTADELGVTLIRDWILSLEDCPEPIAPAP